MKLTFAEKVALVAMGFGLLHHVDHVLRYDHSGWPFKPEVTPFTYTLLVYPVFALLLLLRSWPRVRVAMALLLFLFPVLAHTFLETPADQYRTWAHLPEVNLLHTTSAVFGAGAVAIACLLSLSTFVMLIAFWQEARRRASFLRAVPK